MTHVEFVHDVVNLHNIEWSRKHPPYNTYWEVENLEPRATPSSTPISESLLSIRNC